ncbi:hypothetical protein ACV5Z5_000524 [Salmonella enterica subsp. enterica]
MRRNKHLLAASVLAMIFPLTSQAEDINVDFTATVLATTCSVQHVDCGVRWLERIG